MARPKKEEIAAAVKAVAEKAAVDLTPDEGKQADRVWDAKIDDFRRRHAQIETGALTYYYDLGKFLTDLFSNAKKYHNRTAADVGAALHIDNSTLHRAVQFAAGWDESQFKQALARGITWAKIKALLPVDNLKTRDSLEQKFATDEVTHDDAHRMVRDVVQKEKAEKQAKGEKVDGRGGISPKTSFKVTVEIAKAFLERLSEFKEALKIYEKMEASEKKSECASLLKEVKGSLDKIRTSLNKLENI